MSATLHMANFDLNGGGLCAATNTPNNRFSITMDYLAADCQECREKYREQVKQSSMSPEEKDILRIMFEQNCSKATAEYVHEAGKKLKARILARRNPSGTEGRLASDEELSVLSKKLRPI